MSQLPSLPALTFSLTYFFAESMPYDDTWLATVRRGERTTTTLVHGAEIEFFALWTPPEPRAAAVPRVHAYDHAHDIAFEFALPREDFVDPEEGVKEVVPYARRLAALTTSELRWVLSCRRRNVTGRFVRPGHIDAEIAECSRRDVVEQLRAASAELWSTHICNIEETLAPYRQRINQQGFYREQIERLEDVHRALTRLENAWPTDQPAWIPDWPYKLSELLDATEACIYALRDSARVERLDDYTQSLLTTLHRDALSEEKLAECGAFCVDGVWYRRL